MKNVLKGSALLMLLAFVVSFSACTKDNELIIEDEPSCMDGIKNGDETGVDCGGSCAPCQQTAVTCTDGIQNGDETGVDCGGSCAPCAAEATCTDGVQNGDETGVDCGGSCDPCAAEATCTDGVQNGDETGIDCGGSCAPCAAEATCMDGVQNGDETGVDCGGSCAPCEAEPTCTDGVQNGDETGIDCGGSCAPCTSSVSMKEYFEENAKFSMLNEAIDRAEFDISGAGPFTFFAPNNDAWQALLDSNGWTSIDQVSPTVLKTILQFQVSSTGAYTFSDFSNFFQIEIMFQAKNVYIDMTDPMNIKVVAGLTTVGIVQLDKMTANGVIHETNGVLLF